MHGLSDGDINLAVWLILGELPNSSHTILKAIF